MNWQVWLGFAAASFAMGAIPGPGVTAIVGYALSSGRRTALVSVAGMAVGNAMAMTLSLAGVGVVLAASALAFSILKWMGVIYLVGLGIFTIWRTRNNAEGLAGAPPISPRIAFLSNVAVGTFHPKTIVFFVAFAPQFISPYAPYWPQAVILIATFVGIVALTDAAYALIAARATRLLENPRARLWFGRAGGGALIAAGLATAAARR
jgi:threonine/homoserine/homoserine lactone efflux protein